MNRRFDLIVFDWDGTLMDSAAKIVRCFQSAAADAGVLVPAAEAIRNIIGLGLKEALDRLLPGVDETARQQVVACYRRHFIEIDNTATPLFPGVVEGLAKLNANGFRLAIATGKARRGLDRVLRDTELSRFFCATRCADEAQSKPHPQMLYDLLDVTDIGADRAVMIGDTTYDLQMAMAAAMGSVAVTYGAHDRDALLSHAPLACVDSFVNVCQWLEATS
jgi:phosphoglycolate phosphatase